MGQAQGIKKDKEIHCPCQPKKTIGATRWELVAGPKRINLLAKLPFINSHRNKIYALMLKKTYQQLLRSAFTLISKENPESHVRHTKMLLPVLFHICSNCTKNPPMHLLLHFTAVNKLVQQLP